MDERTYFVLKAIFVIVVTVAVAVVTTYSTRDSKTSYDMSVRVMVDQPQSIGEPAGITNVSKLQQLIPTYAQIVMSNATAQKVAAIVPNVTAPEVLGAVTAAPIEKTQVLDIKAQSEDATKAEDMAYAAASVLIDRINQQQQALKIQESDRLVFSILDPDKTVHADVPQPKRMVALFTAAAFIVSIGALIVYENARYI